VGKADQSQAWQIRADNLVEIPIPGSTATMTQQALTLIGDADVTIATDGTPTVSKSTGTNGAEWDRGAYSTTGSNTDCYVEFKFPSTTGIGALVGLNSDPAADSGAISMDFAIHTSSNNLGIYILEDGNNLYGPSAFAVTDIFQVKRTGTTVTYLKNGTVFFTSPKTSSGAPLCSFMVLTF
jgi:hypothetical protein